MSIYIWQAGSYMSHSTPFHIRQVPHDKGLIKNTSCRPGRQAVDHTPCLWNCNQNLPSSVFEGVEFIRMTQLQRAWIFIKGTLQVCMMYGRHPGGG